MAKQSNGRLWFEAGIDRSQLSKGVTAINRDFQGLQTNAGRTGTAFSDMWRTAALGVGAYLSATAALNMGKQITDLTRQRELMEKSFEVMFGGIDAAKQKIDEVREYAIFSPYTFEGVAKGVQTLSAFGIETDKILPSLRMLGDVAAGNNERFERLTLAFAQTQSASKLMGQDLLQYVNSGFNPLQVLAEKTGKSVGELRKEMENGAISADMVTEAFRLATSEGGKFYGMTTKMADSIEAAKTNFESAWVEKQIEWGKAAQDNIKTMYEFGGAVIENADEIAKVFGVLIATVGTYKASLIAINAVHKLQNTARYSIEAAELQKLVTATHQAENADLAAAVAKGRMSEATATNIASIRAEVAAKLQGLKATAAVAAAEADSAKIAVVAANEKAIAANKRLVLAQAEVKQAQVSNNYKNYESKLNRLNAAQEANLNALKSRRLATDALATAQTKAQTTAQAAATFATQADTAATKAGTTAKNLFALASAKVVGGLRAIGLAFSANPVGLIITALSMAATAWSLFSDGADEATSAMQRFNEEQDKTRENVDRLIGVLQDDTATMLQKRQAYDELTRSSKALTEAYSFEELQQLKTADAAKILNAERDKATYAKLTSEVERYSKALEDSEKISLENAAALAARVSVATLSGGTAIIRDNYDELAEGLEQAKKALADYEKQMQDAKKAEEDLARSNQINASVEALTAQNASLEKRKTAYDEIIALSPEVAEMYDQEALAALTLAQALEVVARAEEIAALRRSQTVNTQLAGNLTPGTSLGVISSDALIENFKQENSKIDKQIASILSEPLPEIVKKASVTGELTDAQKALKAQEDARREMYEQGLLDYETFQQGVDRLAKEHSDRVAAYAAEATSPQQLVQLAAGSKAEMDAEIKALHEKHQTEEYLRKQAAEKELADTEALRAELLERFKDYEDQRKELDAVYQRERGAMFSDEGQTTLAIGFTQSDLDKLNSDYKNALDQLNFNAAKATGQLKELFADASQKSVEELNRIIAYGNELIEALSTGQYSVDLGLSQEQFDSLLTKIPELRELVERLRQDATDVGDSFDNWGKAFDQIQQGFKNADPEMLSAGLQKLSAQIGHVSTLMSSFSQILGGIAEMSGSDVWADIAKGLEGVTSTLETTLSTAAAGMAVGGPTGAIIGGALGLISSLIAAGAEANQAHAEALKELADAEYEYNRALIALRHEREIDEEQFSSIFGTDRYAQSLNAAQAYLERLKELEAQIYSTEYTDMAASRPTNWGSFDEIIAYNEAVEDAQRGLEDLMVVTGSYTTGALWWKEQHDSYSKLLDVYPDLIDAQGNFDAELAQTIIDTQKLDEASEKALQGMIDTAEQAAEAFETMRDYLADIFGDIGYGIAESIADGIRSGQVEVEDVLSGIGDSFEAFIQDMAHSIYLAPMLAEAAEKMMDLQTTQGLTDEERLARMAEIMGAVADGAVDAIPAMEDFYELAKDQAEAAGLDIFKGEDAGQGQATSGAITSIQEEAPGSIDGKLTALQLSSSQTAANTGVMAEGVTNMRDTMDLVRLDVKGIHGQVKLIATHTTHLEAIAADIKQVKTNTAKL